MADGGASISVVDDGPGIPQRVLDRIGQPFLTMSIPYRADASTGFGLYMVRRYMELLGGSFTIGCREEGGTNAELILPLSALQELEALTASPMTCETPQAAFG